MYMNYCRYEGTLHELRACMEDVREHYSEEAEYEVSDREIENFKMLVCEFHEFMVDMDLLDNYGDLNREKIDEIADYMSRSYGEDEDDG